MFRLRVRYDAMNLKGKEFIDKCIQETFKTAEDVKKYVSWYPPQPPQSKYVRTGELGRGISVSHNYYRRGNVIGVYLGWLDDQPPYWIYVTGPLQREYHAITGWRRLDRELAYYEIQYGQRLDQIMKQMWRYL